MSSDSKGGTKILINLKPLYSYWLREKNYRRKPGITERHIKGHPGVSH